LLGGSPKPWEAGYDAPLRVFDRRALDCCRAPDIERREQRTLGGSRTGCCLLQPSRSNLDIKIARQRRLHHAVEHRVAEAAPPAIGQGHSGFGSGRRRIAE
jgi:hypothetical protein